MLGFSKVVYWRWELGKITGLSVQLYRDLGWRLMIDQKYFLTETPFWALTTFYASGGLTRCGPFDKIWLICFRVTSYSIQSWKLEKKKCRNAQNLGIFSFLRGVGIFQPDFLSPNVTEQRCFCVPWKGNFLKFSNFIKEIWCSFKW